MPLFPIATDNVACDDGSNDKKNLAAPESGVNSTPQDWLQVGRSYGTSVSAAQLLEDQDQEAQGVDPPKSRRPSPPSEIGTRHKASDFFEIREEAAPRSDGSHLVTTKHPSSASTRQGARETSSTQSDDETGSDRSRSRRRGGDSRKRKRSGESKGGRSSEKRSKRKSRRRVSSRSQTTNTRTDGSSDGGESGGSKDVDRASLRRKEKIRVTQGNGLFVEDRSGDGNNLTFGQFYRLDVPAYNHAKRSARNATHGNVTSSGKLTRYFGTQGRLGEGDGRTPRIQLWRGDKRQDGGFVGSRPLSDSSSSVYAAVSWSGLACTRRRVARVGADFLPLDPIALTPDDYNELVDSRDGARDDVHVESLEQGVARRTKELNVLTREQPASESIWLDLSDFQEEAVRAVHAGGLWLRSTPPALLRTVLEKRAAVLENALRRNPSSIALWTARLSVADQVQEHDVVDSLWTTAIEMTKNSGTLWLLYLHFKAGHFASFSVPDQRSACARCLKALKAKRDTSRKAWEEEQRAKGVFIMGGTSMLDNDLDHAIIEKDLLHVLWSYCISERAAGFHERAWGAMQAMLEINVRPRGSSVALDDFEAFWDSEAPRIGDARPSLAGISRWRDSNNANKLHSGSIKSLGRRAALTRKSRSGRPPGLLGERKRAVDFFGDGSSSARDGEVSSGECLGGAGDRETSERTKSRSTGTTKDDVLEKAYEAASALTETPALLATSAQIAAADSPMADVIPRKTSAKTEDETAVGALDTSPSTAARAVDEIGGSIGTAHREEQVAEGMEDEQAGPPLSKILDEQDEGARAVEAEGLIWVDETQKTAYSVRHGYRIDVEGAQDSVSGVEYDRILNQMRQGDRDEAQTHRGLRAAAAASNRLWTRALAKREAEQAKQADVLEDVSGRDAYTAWAQAEDSTTREQWQPLRAAEDSDAAEEQPDRVVFVEDLRPFLFNLSQPASSRILIRMTLSMGGVLFPRAEVSHAPDAMTESSGAAALGDGGLAGSLIAAVDSGLQDVWGASGADLPVSGRGVVECTTVNAKSLLPLAVRDAADQFLLLRDEVMRDSSRQRFLRNVLHHLVRSSGPLPADGSKPKGVSSIWDARTEDTLVQLQCTLIMFEGYIATAAGARHDHGNVSGHADDTTSERKRGNISSAEGEVYGHEARKVAKSLLEASEASATDMRLWSSYVQLLSLLGRRQEATKVAEKALSMVQALPEDKKPLAAELFWLTFRLHCGLPLHPRGRNGTSGGAADAGSGFAGLFASNSKRTRTWGRVVHVLCCFAEGSFKREKAKKPKDKDPDQPAEAISPPRIMAARKSLADRVASTAAEISRKGGIIRGGGLDHWTEGVLDATPSLLYYSVAWVWLEYLTRGIEEAGEAMVRCLACAEGTITLAGEGARAGTNTRGIDAGRAVAGNQPYLWKVVPPEAAVGVCLERMHASFAEVMVLVQRHDPLATGTSRVRAALLRGLQSFPANPGMLCMLLETEQFAGSQQRLVHHFSEVSKRRALTWEQGPTPAEWLLSITHQVQAHSCDPMVATIADSTNRLRTETFSEPGPLSLADIDCVASSKVMRCVRDALQSAVASSEECRRDSRRDFPGAVRCEAALHVKEWMPGSYDRLKRSMEVAVTHPTGRRIPLLWRVYMSLEAMRGNYTQAKHLFWRAIHACPGQKMVFMDAVRGQQRARVGATGLRPAFRAKELQDVLDTMLEKGVHLRKEPP